MNKRLVHLHNVYSLIKLFYSNRLLIGLARDRLKQMVEKIYLVVSLAVSSLEDRASRRSYAGCLFQGNLLLAPVVLGKYNIYSFDKKGTYPYYISLIEIGLL